MAEISTATVPTVFVNDSGVSVTWATNTSNVVFDTAPAMVSPSVAAVPAPAQGADGVPWSGPVAFENQMTGDGRIFAPASIGWFADSLPWPFRWTPVDNGGHDGAVVIGRVDGLFRDEAAPGTIFARGVIFNGDTAPPEAAKYLDLMANGAAGGVSVDGDMAEFAVVEKVDANGDFIGLEQHFSQMRLRTMTAVDVPAFIGAHIALADSGVVGGRDVAVGGGGSPDAVTAAAIPVAPPAEWFDDPALDGPTPLTITADGRVCGHLALFGTCHIAQPQCVTPPRGATYAYFHTGEVLTAGGDPVAVGHLTFDTGHADMNANGAAAASHYDHTGTVAADVCAGEDAHGIWVAGALRPGLSDEQIREFRAAPLSGDWRRIGGRLELVAALAVNTPGFPVPRTRARVLVASGQERCLIAFPLPEDFDPMTDEDRVAARTRIVNSLRKSELRRRLVRK